MVRLLLYIIWPPILFHSSYMSQHQNKRPVSYYQICRRTSRGFRACLQNPEISTHQLLEMQLLPEAPMQCCLVLPSIACTNTSTDTVDIVSPYSGLVDTMAMTLVCSICPSRFPACRSTRTYHKIKRMVVCHARCVDLWTPVLGYEHLIKIRSAVCSSLLVFQA